MLWLAGIAFDVRRAELGAQLADPHWVQKWAPDEPPGLRWWLAVDCAPRDRHDLDEVHLEHESLRLPVRSWTELAPRTIEWHEPFDLATNEPQGRVYMADHGDIPEGRIELLRQVGARVEVRWRGRCDLHLDEVLGAGVPFELEAPATLTRIVVQGSEPDDDASLRARLAAHLRIDELEPGPLRIGGRYEDSVEMRSMTFTPRA